MGACGSREQQAPHQSSGMMSTTNDWNDSYEQQNEDLFQDRRKSFLKRTGSKKVSHRDLETASFAKSKSFNAQNTLTAVNDYSVKQSLGKGAFGEVFLAHLGSEQFAIKVLKASALKKMRQGRHGSAFDAVKTEIATMKKIAHPNCVHMFDVIAEEDASTIFLVLEFVDGGPSQMHSKDGRPVPLSERAIWSHMRHLLLGLEYLHTHGIVHRDIKPENLLIAHARSRKGKKKGGSSNGILKIADFGTSCFCEGDANAQKTAGTPALFCPAGRLRRLQLDLEREGGHSRLLLTRAVHHGVARYVRRPGGGPLGCWRDNLPVGVRARAV